MQVFGNQTIFDVALYNTGNVDNAGRIAFFNSIGLDYVFNDGTIFYEDDKAIFNDIVRDGLINYLDLAGKKIIPANGLTSDAVLVCNVGIGCYQIIGADGLRKPNTFVIS
jgi:hypothetical protein